MGYVGACDQEEEVIECASLGVRVFEFQFLLGEGFRVSVFTARLGISRFNFNREETERGWGFRVSVSGFGCYLEVRAQIDHQLPRCLATGAPRS